MSGISLTASMRSNLLSLQNIAGQQDIVQNRLATSLKVSSAIDNPSAYYTASSLNNRAADLTALLDAMSQGVQTIKAASEAIDSGTKFLEQAKAVANQALEAPMDIAARIANETELLAAIASGKKGLIVLENDIIMSKNQAIQLQEGQSLVGAAYLGAEKTASLTFNFTDANLSALIVADNSLLSDFTINYNTDVQNTTTGVIHIIDNASATIQNMDIKVNSSDDNNVGFSAIRVRNAKAILRGTNNISTNSRRNFGLSAIGPKCEVTVEGTLNVATQGAFAFGVYSSSLGTINFSSGSVYNFRNHTSGSGMAFLISSQGNVNVKQNAAMNFDSPYGFYLEGNTSPSSGGNTLNIETGVKINSNSYRLFATNLSQVSNPNPGYNGNVINIAAGIKISGNYNGNIGTWYNNDHILIDNTDANIYYAVTDLPGFGKISDTAPPIPDIDIEMSKPKASSEDTQEAYLASQSQYEILLMQYNSLIKDAFYKGSNLLSGQSLTINFNEDRSSKIDVPGVKAQTEDLGITERNWRNAKDIEQSISELEEAVNSLRGFASEFGNYYSIVTTRQDFTENLINVLEEGADKLTLADMNQESANMLALQTSQQLAVNSLSLASQAAQSILKLF